MLLLLACACLPLLSLALPSHHPRSLHRDRRLPHFPLAMAYYPDWTRTGSVDFSLFDIIIFAFAVPKENMQLYFDNEDAPAMLESIVPLAHAKSTKVMLSVGGWTGSRYFSEALATPENRDTFANNIRYTLDRFQLDGIDIDWEYPGQVGQQGNTESAADTDNMLQFLGVLRQKLSPGALISAAVPDTTFVGSDGQPMSDVSAFSHFFDWITLMNYDTFEARNPPGPNAPLSDACGNSSQPFQNAVTAYNAWTSAGFPSSKIVLGVPAYGYVVESNATRLSARSGLRAHSDDGSGQIQFRSLVNQGVLVQNPDGSFNGSEGFIRGWDSCSATPYLYSISASQVIPYDDPESLGIKAAWARDMNLLGVNLFDVHGDTPQHHLTRALHTSLFPAVVKPLSGVSSVPSVAPVLFPSAISGHVSSSPAGPVPSSQSSPAPLPATPPPGGIILSPR